MIRSCGYSSRFLAIGAIRCAIVRESLVTRLASEVAVVGHRPQFCGQIEVMPQGQSVSTTRARSPVRGHGQSSPRTPFRPTSALPTIGSECVRQSEFLTSTARSHSFEKKLARCLEHAFDCDAFRMYALLIPRIRFHPVSAFLKASFGQLWVNLSKRH